MVSIEHFTRSVDKVVKPEPSGPKLTSNQTAVSVSGPPYHDHRNQLDISKSMVNKTSFVVSIVTHSSLTWLLVLI